MRAAMEMILQGVGEAAELPNSNFCCSDYTASPFRRLLPGQSLTMPC